MTHVKEMLLFGAGLIITVTLIFVGFNVFSKAMNIGRKINEQEEQKLNALELSEIEKYEGQQVRGNRIISYIRTIYGKTTADIRVRVVDAGGGSSSFTVAGSNINKLRDETTPYFISPLAMFTVTIVRDKNDQISGIDITQQ